MASSHDAVVGPPKLEQIITEFFAKTLHIILEARTPNISYHNCDSSDFCRSSQSSSSTSSIRSKDKWFNLALHEFPEVTENMELWRQSSLGELVVDVILSQMPSVQEVTPVFPGSCIVRNPCKKEHSQESSCSGENKSYSEGRGKQIIERWIVQYESGKSSSIVGNVHAKLKQSEKRLHSVEALASCKKLYKRTILLARSLYATVRLLPAYKVLRDLNSSGKTCSFSLKHKISPFAEPFTWTEDAEMDSFTFTPIETACGRLLLSVSYLPKLEDVYSESPTTSPIHFITDYIGSSLANPLERIRSLPIAGPANTCTSSARCHSWSYDHGASPSILSPHSPVSSKKNGMHNLDPQDADCHVDLSEELSATSQPAKPRSQQLLDSKATSSPQLLYFPLSFLSSSLPTAAPCNLPLHIWSPSKRIPLSENRKSYSNQLPKYPSSGPASDEGSTQVDFTKNQVLDSASTRTISRKKPNLFISPGFQIGTTLQKALSFGQYSTRFTATKSPYDSPPVSYGSRILSLPNNYDDSDIICPFSIEDHITRSESSGGEGSSAPVERPQHVAVGALVAMLKMAPPLHRDFSCSTSTCQVSKYKDKDGNIQDLEPAGDVQDVHAIAELVLFKSQTRAQALEEFRSYKQMKDLLII